MGTPAENGGSGGARWCAVTGGRGFMARHLVAALLRSGEWRVRVTDLAPAVAMDAAEEDGILGAALRDGRAVYAAADVCDIGQLTQVFQGVDAVFHTAAANPDINNFQLHYKVNVEGTKNVINACVKCNVKRLIHTSSSGVVFDGIHGLFDIDESVPYPDTFPDAYAQSKAEAEKLVTKANGKYELMTCSIRPGSIFGPGGVMVPYLRSYGRMMVIIGNGKNSDDFVYVENVVHGHICAEKTLSTQEGSRICGGKAYFITNMEPMNLWDFIFMFLEELGYKRKFKIRIPLAIIKPIAHIIEWSYNKVFHVYGMHQPKLLTPARLKYISLDRTFSCRKAVEQLGYKPLVSLKDGIKITINSAIGPNI